MKRKLRKIEIEAAAVVIVLAGTAAVAGVKLIKKHTQYLIRKAAAAFPEKPEEETKKTEKPERKTLEAENSEENMEKGVDIAPSV